MGMFTTVVHDGQEFQFKTGEDQCDTYKVGDKIPWEPAPRYPGQCIDGVHYGHGDGANNCFVIVKDCTIIAIEPTSRKREDLVTKYDIRDPDPNLWTDEQWAEEARQKAAAEAKYQAWCKEQGMDPKSDPAAVQYYMYLMLRQRSFMSQIFPVPKV